MVPLLQLISRGSPMSFEDSSRIIPLFYLFSSLFSHSLISIHDNEFFGDPIEGKNFEKWVCCWPYGLSAFKGNWKALEDPPPPPFFFFLKFFCVCWFGGKKWLKIGCFSCRSETIIHDAFHSGGVNPAVTMPSRCLLGDHQASIPGNKARSSGRICHRISEYWGHY
jgi:hypothetical protein